MPIFLLQMQEALALTTEAAKATAVFSNESLENLGNATMENLSEAVAAAGEVAEMICPEITQQQNIFLKNFAYWIEGVILLSIGCPGILGMVHLLLLTMILAHFSRPS